jgi:hypothetical protein
MEAMAAATMATLNLKQNPFSPLSSLVFRQHSGIVAPYSGIYGSPFSISRPISIKRPRNASNVLKPKIVRSVEGNGIATTVAVNEEIPIEKRYIIQRWFWFYTILEMGIGEGGSVKVVQTIWRVVQHRSPPPPPPPPQWAPPPCGLALGFVSWLT